MSFQIGDIVLDTFSGRHGVVTAIGSNPAVPTVRQYEVDFGGAVEKIYSTRLKKVPMQKVVEIVPVFGGAVDMEIDDFLAHLDRLEEGNEPDSEL